jgi:predicted  nucleic acid-binding Zn-ribbon protein
MMTPQSLVHVLLKKKDEIASQLTELQSVLQKMSLKQKTLRIKIEGYFDEEVKKLLLDGLDQDLQTTKDNIRSLELKLAYSEELQQDINSYEEGIFFFFLSFYSYIRLYSRLDRSWAKCSSA